MTAPQPLPGPREPKTEHQGQAGVSGASRRGSHRLQSALHCERAWAFRYYYGGDGGRLSPNTNKSYLTLGTLFHTLLAYHYAKEMKTKPAWTAEPLDVALEKDAMGQPTLIDSAREMYAAYARHWDAEPGEMISVEEEFVSRLGDMIPDCPEDVEDEEVSCRVDAIRVVAGQAWVWDHKTSRANYRSGRLTAWKDNGGYDCALQIPQNLRILRAQSDPRLAHWPIAGFVINRATREKPYDFDRHQVRLSPFVYESSPRMMIAAVRREKDMTTRFAGGEKPVPNFGYHCQRCDYRPICYANSRGERQRVIDSGFTQTIDPKPDEQLVQLPTTT